MIDSIIVTIPHSEIRDHIYFRYNNGGMVHPDHFFLPDIPVCKGNCFQKSFMIARLYTINYLAWIYHGRNCCPKNVWNPKNIKN